MPAGAAYRQTSKSSEWLRVQATDERCRDGVIFEDENQHGSIEGFEQQVSRCRRFFQRAEDLLVIAAHGTLRTSVSQTRSSCTCSLASTRVLSGGSASTAAPRTG